MIDIAYCPKCHTRYSAEFQEVACPHSAKDDADYRLRGNNTEHPEVEETLP